MEGKKDLTGGVIRKYVVIMEKGVLYSKVGTQELGCTLCSGARSQSQREKELVVIQHDKCVGGMSFLLFLPRVKPAV
ncbi:MAG TPA: hypothetical protein VL087_07000 [Nitrospirota bacterium]|nr:hypothetical protein [Nitrospirota bacterium]